MTALMSWIAVLGCIVAVVCVAEAIDWLLDLFIPEPPDD